MPNGKSGPRMPDSIFLLGEKPDLSDIHPRFISRIQSVLFEKEEGARMGLVKTYCLLKKLTNQLHAYEQAFDKAQYKFLADKCESLCRNSRAAATNDRPHLPQVLSLREEVIDLRNIIVAATQGAHQEEAARSVRHSTSTDGSGQGADANGSVRSDPLANTERLPKRKLTSKNEPARRLAPETAIDQQSPTGRLSS